MRTWLLAAIVMASLGVAGCNTVQGFGKDVSSAGDAVSNAADKHK